MLGREQDLWNTTKSSSSAKEVLDALLGFGNGKRRLNKALVLNNFIITHVAATSSSTKTQQKKRLITNIELTNLLQRLPNVIKLSINSRYLLDLLVANLLTCVEKVEEVGTLSTLSAYLQLWHLFSMSDLFNYRSSLPNQIQIKDLLLTDQQQYIFQRVKWHQNKRIK